MVYFYSYVTNQESEIQVATGQQARVTAQIRIWNIYLKSSCCPLEHDVIRIGNEERTQNRSQCVRPRVLRDSIELCLAHSRWSG